MNIYKLLNCILCLLIHGIVNIIYYNISNNNNNRYNDKVKQPKQKDTINKKKQN